MSQHDFDIDNATAAAARVDINLALKALGSLSSGTAAPATTYANMMWYDTATNWLWVRNEANSAWIRFAYLDQTTNQIALVDNTNVVNTSGTQVGLLGDQTTATWQAGTGTTQSLVSPANVKAAVLALAPVNTSTVLAATAGASAGAVGSYAWAMRTTSGTFGSTVAGSSLYPASLRGNEGSTTQWYWSNFYTGLNNGTLSGTWRQLGGYQTVSLAQTTLFLRIS
jgi:hypothetical protein